MIVAKALLVVVHVYLWLILLFGCLPALPTRQLIASEDGARRIHGNNS